MNELNDVISPEEELAAAEAKLSNEDDSNEAPPSDIVAFNELRSCADLFRLYEKKQLLIDPSYQREVVWSARDQTRFIDSLAKQLPIPSMCISFDYRTEKREMVDGLQRMSGIVKFLSDPKWRLSTLDDIDPRLSGKTVADIKLKEPLIYSRIEDTTIAVTVIRCDFSKKTHQEYLFTIFHRLNTGGSKLTNQEIRNCIYSGPLNHLLKEIAANEKFLKLMNLDPNKKDRFAAEELILRSLCFSETFSDYNGRLATHLNDYMSKYRDADDKEIAGFRSKFLTAIDVIFSKIQSGDAL